MPLQQSNPFLFPDLLSCLEFINRDGHYYVASPYVPKEYRAFPEAIIRHIWVNRLVLHYHYPAHSLRLEFPVQMGITKKRADIAIMGESGTPHTIIEVKQVIDDSAIEQLKSYMRSTAATHGAVVSATHFAAFSCSERGIVVDKADLPIYGGTLTLFDATYPEAKGAESADDALKRKLSIEEFTRLNARQIRLVVKGVSIVMTNSQVASFSKLNKTLLDNGVVIPYTVKQAEWQTLFSALFESASLPVIETIKPGQEGHNVLEYLLAKRLKDGNEAYTIREAILAVRNQEFPFMRKNELAKSLEKTGVRVLHKSFVIGNSYGSEIFRGTPFIEKWRKYLLSLPNVTRHDNKTIKFNGICTKCIAVPYYLLGTNENLKSAA